MPTQDQIKSAMLRREARKQAREANIEQAHVEAKTLSDTLAKAKAEAAKPQRAAAPKKSRREQRDAQRAATERDVKQQGTSTVEGPDDATIQQHLGTDATGRVPLHVLNALAKRSARALRGDAKAIANAAGKAAFGAAVGRRERRSDKHARVRDAQAAMAKHRLALEAQQKAE